MVFPHMIGDILKDFTSWPADDSELEAIKARSFRRARIVGWAAVGCAVGALSSGYLYASLEKQDRTPTPVQTGNQARDVVQAWEKLP